MFHLIAAAATCCKRKAKVFDAFNAYEGCWKEKRKLKIKKLK